MSAIDDPAGRAVERDGAVVTVSLADPATRNALTDGALAWLAAELARLDADPGVRAIVVAGSDEVFASGADVRALASRDTVELFAGERFRNWDAIRAIRTPMVAAVSGFCLGAGCELALLADVAVASETARFGLPETMLGLIPGAGGTQRLPRAVGKAKAMDMVLTGRLLGAAEAERAGLVARVTDAGEWRAVAAEMAGQIAARPAVAQTLARQLLADAADLPLHAGLEAERACFLVAFGTEDAREGLEAFLAKRDPCFRHR